jgi:hypothetical protein
VALPEDDPDSAKACHHAYGVALLALGRSQEAQAHLNWQPPAQ